MRSFFTSRARKLRRILESATSGNVPVEAAWREPLDGLPGGRSCGQLPRGKSRPRVEAVNDKEKHHGSSEEAGSEEGSGKEAGSEEACGEEAGSEEARREEAGREEEVVIG